ncbi:unnamed protein product [Heterobilharzia americana]|nr:unnamed protein product [Heterobilharzia americana]CAH8446301.1 unnamed protein product [Heterobilharzia americana]CAH8446307.1 unnamed protein product [Heterobilharzia americana]
MNICLTHTHTHFSCLYSIQQYKYSLIHVKNKPLQTTSDKPNIMKTWLLALLVVIYIQCAMTYVRRKGDEGEKQLSRSGVNINRFLTDNKDVLGHPKSKHRHRGRKGVRGRKCSHGRCRGDRHRKGAPYGIGGSGMPGGQDYRGSGQGGIGLFGQRNTGVKSGSSNGVVGGQGGGLGGILGQNGGGIGRVVSQQGGGLRGEVSQRGGGLGGLFGKQGGGLGGILGQNIGGLSGILGKQGGGLGGILGQNIGGLSGILGQQGGGLGGLGKMVSGLGGGNPLGKLFG